MIYKRLSRGELLKAIQDHARIVSKDGDDVIEWIKELECYRMSLRGTKIFVDRFEENLTIGGKITMFSVIKVNAYDLSFDNMIGIIETSDWLVEIPEEGEQ